MRRALKDLVPIEVLERRRKAYLARGPLASLQGARNKIEKLFANSLSAEYGLIDPVQLRAAYEQTTNGTNTNSTSALMRSIAFELWLRSSLTVIAPR
jgi:asparagine synthase (glutamine-hydrolysing)